MRRRCASCSRVVRRRKSRCSTCAWAASAGIEVLRRCSHARTRFVVLTGHGTVEAAVEAMKLGAFSFLEKPVDAEVLAPLLAQAMQPRSRKARGEGGATGRAAAGRRERRDAAGAPLRRARRARRDETVAIYGETGTGKEVVARHLHFAERARRALRRVQRAAASQRELFESELFGHRARCVHRRQRSDHPGLLREANGGTLFIDEVAELPLDTPGQAAARARERADPAGGRGARGRRSTCASSPPPTATCGPRCKAGRFREDLYFRLQVLPLVLPPLRERREDIVPLAEHLLGRLGDRRATAPKTHAHCMVSYDWPGNVRELLNVLRRATLFADGPELDAELMRRMLAASVFATARAELASEPHASSVTSARAAWPRSSAPTSSAC